MTPTAGPSNVHRHAPGAAASVVVERGPDNVRVNILNTRSTQAAPGETSRSAGTRLGLVGVRERVTLLAGGFSTGPTLDGGFRMTAELPLREPTGPGPDTRRARQDKQVRKDETAAEDSAPSTAAPRTTVPWTQFGLWERQATSAVLAVCLVGIAVLVAVIAAALPWYSSEYRSNVDKPPTDAVAVGMTREEVGRIIGPDDALARLAARSVESSPPPSARGCLYAQEWPNQRQARVLRYCFVQDRLISVDRFEIGRGDGLEGP
ncbi:hypothetical protein ACIPSA_42245 [Streptomyces sp. NPDC086549]|uniref:ATP-binding protein n=1 Tax=Streptomyces sp. NPDC086549 TaxID=3365752 RepID=UPI0037FCC5CD